MSVLVAILETIAAPVNPSLPRSRGKPQGDPRAAPFSSVDVLSSGNTKRFLDLRSRTLAL